MPPLTWTDWNTKVHPTVHHEGRWLARATGRARRGQDLRAESWTSGAEGCSGPSRGAQCSGWLREGAPVSQPPASIRSPLPPPPPPASEYTHHWAPNWASEGIKVTPMPFSPMLESFWNSPTWKQECESQSPIVVSNSATPWTIESVKFSRPEHCSGLPFPSSGDLPNPEIEPRSPGLQADSLPSEPLGKLRIPLKYPWTQLCRSGSQMPGAVQTKQAFHLSVLWISTLILVYGQLFQNQDSAGNILVLGIRGVFPQAARTVSDSQQDTQRGVGF